MRHRRYAGGAQAILALALAAATLVACSSGDAPGAGGTASPQTTPFVAQPATGAAGTPGSPTASASAAATLSVTSPAFADGQPIPLEYTCDGTNASPPIAWSGAPAGTAAFAIVMQDPDAPRGTFTHWLLYDLSSSVTSLEAGVAQGLAAAGGTQGTNSAGTLGYTGPCPPAGPAHHYVFSVFALRAPVGVPAGATASAALAAIRDNQIAAGQIIATFAR